MRKDESSLRLDLLRFPLIVGVVFIHAYASQTNFADGTTGVSNTGAVVGFVRNFVSQGVARIAVPLFFLMSGYLFFKGFQPSVEAYKAKFQSRARTLVVPFVFWNLLVLAVYAVGQALPPTKAFFAGNVIPLNKPVELVCMILGIGRNPIAYQFWFIRDLIILVALTPIVGLLRRWGGLALSVGLLALWFVNWWPIEPPRIEATCFFVMGCVVAVWGKSLFDLDKYGPVLSAIYAVAAIADGALFGSPYGEYVHRTAILIGIPCALYVTKIVLRNEKVSARLLALAACSFFIYAAHEPLMTITRKIVFRALHPHSGYVILALYFLIPIAIIAFLAWMYGLLLRVAPKVTKTVTGGR